MKIKPRRASDPDRYRKVDALNYDRKRLDPAWCARQYEREQRWAKANPLKRKEQAGRYYERNRTRLLFEGRLERLLNAVVIAGGNHP